MVIKKKKHDSPAVEIHHFPPPGLGAPISGECDGTYGEDVRGSRSKAQMFPLIKMKMSSSKQIHPQEPAFHHSVSLVARLGLDLVHSPFGLLFSHHQRL